MSSSPDFFLFFLPSEGTTDTLKQQRWFISFWLIDDACRVLTWDEGGILNENGWNLIAKWVEYLTLELSFESFLFDLGADSTDLSTLTDFGDLELQFKQFIWNFLSFNESTDEWGDEINFLFGSFSLVFDTSEFPAVLLFTIQTFGFSRISSLSSIDFILTLLLFLSNEFFVRLSLAFSLESIFEKKRKQIV